MPELCYRHPVLANIRGDKQPCKWCSVCGEIVGSGHVAAWLAPECLDRYGSVCNDQHHKRVLVCEQCLFA